MKKRTIYALGFFDGVHIGHQALLKACKELAEKENCRPGVITFTTHPDSLVSGSAPRLISTLADRRKLLEQYGMEVVVELPFDQKLMQTPWQDFLNMVKEEYAAAGFVCGQDFRFGQRGEGTAALLQEACEKEGLPCRVVAEQKMEGITVSSTYIRSLLEAGEMEKATAFLGHPFCLTETIVEGKKLGRTLSIPTANMALPQELVQPKLGVYAGRIVIDGKTYVAVTNIGTRPTVDGEGITVESWLPDFSGDLYGKTLTLNLSHFIRGEKKFPNLAALQAEIQENARQARKLLGK